ncbi:MAG: ABC transporter permease [Deltaproteobacteria bacterium]|nr:ABC transporter permease [Deltaproteobacteria bacterium]
MAKIKSTLASRLGKKVFNRSVLRGVISVSLCLALWELGRAVKLPLLEAMPAPSEIFGVIKKLVLDPAFWGNWAASYQRVLTGFIAAQLVGIPLGLAMAVSRAFYGLTFSVFEIIRPIPPLAWVPISIIFWPTTETSIAFVIFLGAFFTVVINVLGGARNIDVRYTRAAISLGSRPWDIFFKIVLPATLPSIFTGMAVGMGITWEVVVAAEMIAGKSGLGYLTWSSYVGGNYPQIVVGMMSIGIAGYLSSWAIRLLGRLAMPWQRIF